MVQWLLYCKAFNKIVPPPPAPARSRFHALQAIETLLALDFAAPVTADAGLGQQLADDSASVSRSLGLLPGASLPIVVGGDALEGWLAQPDDIRVEDD